MVIRATQFNLYLGLLLLALATGCQTGDKDKPMATLRVHLEVSPTETAVNGPVPVYRAMPVMVNIDKAPMVTEDDLTSAKLVDQPGGFAIELQFDDHGILVLNQYASANPGKHYVVYSQWGTGKFKQERWLAAPLMPRNISNGTLTFTPDATREEAQEIVDGLSNAIKDRN